MPFHWFIIFIITEITGNIVPLKLIFHYDCFYIYIYIFFFSVTFLKLFVRNIVPFLLHCVPLVLMLSLNVTCFINQYFLQEKNPCYLSKQNLVIFLHFVITLQIKENNDILIN